MRNWKIIHWLTTWTCSADYSRVYLHEKVLHSTKNVRSLNSGSPLPSTNSLSRTALLLSVRHCTVAFPGAVLFQFQSHGLFHVQLHGLKRQIKRTWGEWRFCVFIKDVLNSTKIWNTMEIHLSII